MLKTDILLQLCLAFSIVDLFEFACLLQKFDTISFPPPTKMDLKSPKSPGWKNKFETLTRRRPRDDQDDIMAELDIMTENLRQIEVHILLEHLRKKSISFIGIGHEKLQTFFIDDTINKEIIFCFQPRGLQSKGGEPQNICTYIFLYLSR